jgi:hypothetical protein
MGNIEITRQAMELEQDAQTIVEMVKSGQVNPLEAQIFLKTLVKNATDAINQINEDVMIEFGKHGGKSVQFKGHEFKLTSGGRYEFKHIAEWSEKKAELEAIEEKAKAAYQNASKGLQVVSNDGEIIEAAIYKANKESVSVTELKK